MNLDHICYLTLLSLLPLLVLPAFLLWLGILWAVLLLLFCLWRRDNFLLIAALLIGISYGRIAIFAENTAIQTAYTTVENITIKQIIKQNDYQSAVGIRENGEKIYLTWQAEIALNLGALYQAELRLRPVSSRLNEGNFNRQRWLLAQGIQATALVKNATLLAETANFRLDWFKQLRQQTDGLSTQGIILALAFGERAWLLPEHWQLFQQTATAHLIAISGLHIALSFGIGYWAAHLLLGVIFSGIYYIKRKQMLFSSHFFAIFVGFLTACLYSFLAGFSVPTTRAMIAISLVLLCRLTRRHYTPWQLWLRGVLLLILLDPLSLLSDSFWLSILAVASLIFWYRYFPIQAFTWLDLCCKRSKLSKFLLSLIHLQVGITLCFLPVQFYFFEGYSPFAFLANLIIVPLYSMVVVPLILFGLFGAALLPVWEVVDSLLQLSLDLIMPLSHDWKVLSISTQWRWICMDCCLLALIYFRQQWKSILTLIVVFGLTGWQIPKWFQQWQGVPNLEWLHFDVGQGLAMALIYETSGQKRAIIYDTGASWQGGSMAELEIIPYLNRKGIKIEAIILSHDDNDHSGGIQPLLRHFPRVQLILSAQNHYSNMPFSACIAGQQWQFGELRLLAVFPFELAKRAKNEHSCVLVGTIGAFRFLLTGDSGIAQEQLFASQVGKIDLLQVGHHGSKTSSSYTLLSTTRPDYAFISSGRFNPWKMPSLSVVSRLKEFNITPFNTAESGMIKVKFYPTYYEISTERNRWTAWYSRYLGKAAQ